MIWVWIALIALGVLLVSYLAFGFFLFRFLCKPDRAKSASLDGNADRSLQPYVTVIKQKALERIALSREVVSIRAFDGILLRARLYPNKKTDRFVILVHGYHSSPGWDFGESFSMYYDEGYSILALDDRGHGSEGDYIGFGALDQHDVRSWMEWLIQQYGYAIKIALVGVSMGAATVMLTSGNEPIPQLAAVIADCGYSSGTEQFRYLIRQKKVPPMLLTAVTSLWCKLLAGYFFSDAEPKRALQKSHTPTLFLHGTADTFVPYAMLEENYEACAATKRKESFEGAIHGESSYKYPQRYREVVTSFLSPYMV